MRILYLDLGMGAAGDMLSAALLELFPEQERRKVLDRLNSLGIPKVQFKAEPAVKCGISGTHMRVLIDGAEEGEAYHSEAAEHEHDHEHCHNHEHGEACDHSHEHNHDHNHGCGEDRHSESDYCGSEAHGHEHRHDEAAGEACSHAAEHEHSHGGHTHTHNSMAGIAHILNDHMQLEESVKADVEAVYGLIAEAESHVHGVPVTEIHFHEVGNMDAIADVTAVSVMLSMLKPDRIVASPVNTGGGSVRCAHGIMPVPAPATASLLEDIPSYDSGIRGELLTPTGAALIRHFADSFGSRPAMRIERVGYGMGSKDFEAANCVRVILGESTDDQGKDNNPAPANAFKADNAEDSASDKAARLSGSADTDGLTDTVIELSANIDDMSAEELGFAFERLLEAGALDVWTEAALMKKQRQGVILKLLCREDMRESIVRAIFRYTSTIGVREAVMHRYTLRRETREYAVSCGSIRAKHVSGYGVEREKLEYEDLAAAAAAKHISIAAVRRQIEEEI